MSAILLTEARTMLACFIGPGEDESKDLDQELKELAAVSVELGLIMKEISRIEGVVSRRLRKALQQADEQKLWAKT